MHGPERQYVDLDRDEYILLKWYVANVRGLINADISAVPGRLTSLVKGGHSEKEMARYVQLARQIFQHDPDLIMVQDARLDDVLKQLTAAGC
jgi:hypothetical protein